MSAPPVRGRLRALLVEDEWLARSFLVELLERTGRIEVVAAVATSREADQALTASAALAIDVAFVDVKLAGPGGDASGLAWVRNISRRAAPPLFVLATAFPEHAVAAFDLNVVDYLLKPFTQERIDACARKLTVRAAPIGNVTHPLRVVARRDRALVFLDLDEVWACEAEGRFTYVHATRGRFELDLTLSAISSSLGDRVARVHRNWLVNPARVLELRREDGGTALVVGASVEACVSVPVARERAQAVRDLLVQSAAGVRR